MSSAQLRRHHDDTKAAVASGSSVPSTSPPSLSSSSTLSLPPAPQSLVAPSAKAPHTGLLDAQKLLASIALSRPTPFGSIPQRRASDDSRHKRQHQRRQVTSAGFDSSSTPPSPAASQRTLTKNGYARRTSDTQQDQSPNLSTIALLAPASDAALSVSDTAFEYPARGWPRRTSFVADVKGKGKATQELHSGDNGDVQFSLSPSSPVSPELPSEEWDLHPNASLTRHHPRSRQATSSRSRDSTSPSTPASSRSSSLHRKPSLLANKSSSPPISSSHTVPAIGRTTNNAAVNSDSIRSARRSSGKESQSLAERGSLAEVAGAALPSLYSMSRGRSAHVSPSRRWDRRGASVSVLSCAPFQLQDVKSEAGNVHDQLSVTEKASVTGTRTEKMRADSAGSLEAALFESDDDSELFAPSDDDADTEEESRRSHGTSRATSRRSSIDRDRRRELRILLAPSSSGQESNSGSQGRMYGHSLQSQTTTTGASDDFTWNDDRGSVGGVSQVSSGMSPPEPRDPDGLRGPAHQSPPATSVVTTADLADDESDGMIGTSAASILDRRAHSGRRALPAALKSFAPARVSTLDMIPSGMTPNEKTCAEVQSRVTDTTKVFSDHTDVDETNRTKANPDSTLTQGAVSSVLVDAETDPLLGSSFGSVADNMQIDAVEWNDAASRRDSKSSLVLSPTSSPRPESAKTMSTRKSVAEQEDERRTGFAAAYQNRIAALSMRLWTPGKNARDTAGTAVADPPTSTGTKAEQSDAVHESLLSSSWRHLTSLPNLLLMPTLGASASAARASNAQFVSPQQQSGSVASVKGEKVSLDMHAAQTAEAHLSKRQDAERTIVAIDRALGERPQPRSSTAAPPSEAYSSQDEAADSTARASPTRSATEAPPPPPPTRGGRGVMTPLEADADISAYVSGLGLPIDPDVELSSVVHLQTFRTDSRIRRATSASRKDPSSTKLQRRRVSEDQPSSLRSSSPSAASRVARSSDDGSFTEVRPKTDAASPSASAIVFSEGQARKSLRRRRSPSSQRITSGADRGRAQAAQPRCSRPAVSAPVPGDFTAYSDHSHSEEDSHSSDTTGSSADRDRSRQSAVRPAATDESSVSRQFNQDDEHEHSQRGRGRRHRQRRSTSPASQQQCAIGLFSSTTSLSRTRSGSRRLPGHVSSATNSTLVQRVRSSPDLSSMGVTLSEDDTSSKSAVTSAATSEDDEVGDDLFASSRGRAGSVKRVSASLKHSESSRQRQLSRTGPVNKTAHRNASAQSGVSPSYDVAALAETKMGVAAWSQPRRRSLPNAASASQQVLAAAAAIPASSSTTARLPIVGADSITHLAGRPSMVSNGAHLLMLSLELEMMRNRKITGSLKPRWLKARMRTEPFGPAAIVAMMAERSLYAGGNTTTGSSGGGDDDDDDGGDDDADNEHMLGQDDDSSHGEAPNAEEMDVDNDDQEVVVSSLKRSARPFKHASPHHPSALHEHRAHIGLHTSHHQRGHSSGGRHAPASLHHNRAAHVVDRTAAQPRRGSSLRFEVLPSASSSSQSTVPHSTS